MNRDTSYLSYRPSTAPWPTNVREECSEVDRVASRLCRLATAAGTLGLSALSDDLNDAAQTLDQVAANIRVHNSQKLDQDLKDAQALNARLREANASLAA